MEITWDVSASKTQSPISPFRAKALTKAQIQQTVDDFVWTAVLAQQVGYNGIKIMASGGFLLSQFLSPRTNHRMDYFFFYGCMALLSSAMPMACNPLFTYRVILVMVRANGKFRNKLALPTSSLYKSYANGALALL
ncbi:hypothetical protein ACA910_010070 [Epithemia clementina (nom. ined.)]